MVILLLLRKKNVLCGFEQSCGPAPADLTWGGRWFLGEIDRGITVAA